MRRKNIQILLSVFICFLLNFSPIETNAQSEIIDQILNQAVEKLGPDQQSSFYAALTNFSVHPDIATATYNISVEGAEDPTLSILRIPLQYVFTLEGQNWQPLVRASFAYQTLEMNLDLAPDESVDLEWKTFGGSLSAGAHVPIRDDFTLVLVLNGGIIRTESKADYSGFISETFLKPAFDGIVFNWDADVWLLGAALGMDYNHEFQRFNLGAHGSLTHNYVESFESSSGKIDFNSQVTTLDLILESVIPTDLTVSSFPISLVANIGNTTFFGSDSDALGFSYFFEGGLALEADLSKKNWSLRKLRLGAKGIYGEDVTGWSVIFGYRF